LYSSFENLYKFKNSLDNDGVVFCFCGPTSHDMIVGIGSLLKQKMELENENSSTIIKVFGVFVEQMQNIIDYSAEKVPSSDSFNSKSSFGGRANDSIFDYIRLEEFAEDLERYCKRHRYTPILKAAEAVGLE
jgi:hypothetical protein